MFKKFCYYYLFKKKKSSCWHDVGVGVAQKVQKSASLIMNTLSSSTFVSSKFFELEKFHSFVLRTFL